VQNKYLTAGQLRIPLARDEIKFILLVMVGLKLNVLVWGDCFDGDSDDGYLW